MAIEPKIKAVVSYEDYLNSEFWQSLDPYNSIEIPINNKPTTYALWWKISEERIPNDLIIQPWRTYNCSIFTYYSNQYDPDPDNFTIDSGIALNNYNHDKTPTITDFTQYIIFARMSESIPVPSFIDLWITSIINSDPPIIVTRKVTSANINNIHILGLFKYKGA